MRLFNRNQRVIATNVSVHDNAGYGILARKIDATNVAATGNGSMGIAAMWLDRNGTLRGTAIVASGNAMEGVFAKAAIVDGLVTQGNGRFGVNAYRVRLANSTLTGNGLAIPDAIDLLATRRPSVELTTCGRSGKIVGDAGVVGDWDVCTDD